jgi:hypothetical protein
MTINTSNQLSTNLPKAYQLYPNGNQNCGNCVHFLESGYCNLFKASVQSFAWCKKWKGGANVTR